MPLELLVALTALLPFAVAAFPFDRGAGDDEADDGEGHEDEETGGSEDVILPVEGRGPDEGTIGTGEDTTAGTDGDDTITGSEIGDTLVGGAGDDVLSGLGESDRIEGGSGADYAEGGSGNDTITGGSGEDTLMGGSGNDLLWGSDETGDDGESDLLVGGTGDDTLMLGHGDLGLGGEGADRFVLADGAVIEDFDEAEDMVVFTYGGEVPPEIASQVAGPSGLVVTLDNGASVTLVGRSDPITSSSYAFVRDSAT
ncbi:calcium-binding protein [Alloyangia pacifica]|uniref:Hemolysin-type calcium-binding repeat-containing protein n=1 Tax=Alloyangia pacifica TaxID=311180 RepID=A0A1I6NSB9_9RHOB|nr:calcium-binding protein [Alloyangia pacifica]SDH63302.1 Hemolysin-type calcium-binding repeat-containing protein [Alloyangia pacifica]SFS30847.1 Hemolysin-type calcium-binding repeat-containing protein [Alloyangia pacifica]